MRRFHWPVGFLVVGAVVRCSAGRGDALEPVDRLGQECGPGLSVVLSARRSAERSAPAPSRELEAISWIS